MKANFRRLLSMLLVLAMVAGMIPAAFAEGEVVEVSTSATLITALKNGGTVKLTGDVALGAVAEIPANVTAVLDLNGKTLSSTDSTTRYIYNKGNLTVKDSNGGGKIDMIATANTGDRATCINNEGNLTIEGGELISKTSDACAKTNYTIFSKVGNVNITGGTIKAEHNGTKNLSVYALGLGNTGTATTIRNATISVNSQCNSKDYYTAPIYLTNDAKTQVTIESGTFTATMKHSVGASLIRGGSNTSKSTLTVTGGAFDIGVGSRGLIAGMTDDGQVAVTGGTFTNNGTKIDVSGYIPKGYTQNPDGSVSNSNESPEEPGDNVIDTTEELQAALNKGGNVTLTGDIALTAKIAIPADVTVTLDLNGHKITSNDGYNKNIDNAGTLTIEDSGEDGEISVVSKSGVAQNIICLNNTGTLTIEDGKFTAVSNVRTAYVLYSTSPSVTINGGEFEASLTKSASYSAHALALGGDGSEDAVATINGGTFTATSISTSGSARCAPLFARGEDKIHITINGGTFTATRTDATRGASAWRYGDKSENVTITIKDGTFSAENAGDNGFVSSQKGTLNISGGTFQYDGTIFEVQPTSITGGTFVKQDGTKNDIGTYLTGDYTQMANGTVSFLEMTEVATSEDFCAALTKGGRVKLTDSFELTGMATIPAGVTVILDLNGKTIESKDGTAYYIYNLGNLTVRDSGEGGKIIMSASDNHGERTNCINNEGNLTIEGGELISKSSDAFTKTNYTIFNKAGNITITGGTIKAENENNISVYALGLGGSGNVDISNATFSVTSQSNSRSYYAAIIYLTSNSAVQVTINSGTFDATMKHSVGASIMRAGSGTGNAKLTINNGTFDIGVGSHGLFVNTQPQNASITGGTFLKEDGTKNDLGGYLSNGYSQLSNGTVIKGTTTSLLVSELISYYTNHQDAAATDIARVLADLKNADPALGASWEKIMNYWSAANAEGFVNVTTVPQNLPNDNSLAIVILGYQLNDDGTMKDELIGRLQAGLAIANAYPNTYVCVTGGGTAANNTSITEGGLMGQWLLENGLSEDRLIIEDKAGSTVANAKNTYDVLVANYPSVENIVMVTSDYHISRGSLLYYTKFVLEAQATGGKEIGIIANCGYATGKTYETIATQSKSLCSLVGVTYNDLPAVTLSVLKSLTVTQEAPYVTGDDLALTVTANYDSGYSKFVDATITGFDKTKGPDQIVTISYTENGVTCEGTFRLTNTRGQIYNTKAVEVNSFADFVAAMADGGNIRLTGSFELTAKAEIPAGVSVILDLNSKTITSNDGAKVHIDNKGELTILDSSESQTGTIVSKSKSGSSESILCLNNEGALTIESGSFEVESNNRSCYAVFSKGASVVINGGTFEANYISTTGVYVCHTLGLGGTDSTAAINGGKFNAYSTSGSESARSAPIYVLKESNVQITVNGGDFTATRAGSDGASFIRWGEDSKPTVTIKAGKVQITEGDTQRLFDGKKGTLTVTGGQFLKIEGEPYDIMEYLGEGYEQLDDGSVVVDDPNMPEVVELDGVKYKSLLRALNKSKAGDVLALRADVQLQDTLVIPEAVHIDLQGNVFEVDSLIAEGSQITDSTQRGLLKVAKDRAIFNAGNQQLPVWDEAAGGYRLAQVKIQTKAAATTGVYYFRYDLVNAVWEKLLLKNMKDPVYKVSLLLHVDGIETPFEVPANMLEMLYEDTTGKGAIKVTFIGMEEKLDIQVGVASREVEITKSTGAEPTPVISANGPVGQVDTLPADTRTFLTDAAIKYDNATIADLVDMTSAKTSTSKDLYKNLQPVAFNWSLENPKFVKANTKFYIELSTNSDFTESRVVDCVNYVAGRQQQSEIVWNLMTDTTYYWRVVTTLADGTEVTTETKTIHTEAGPRMVYAEGAENTRDLGGWLVSHDVILSDGTVVYKAGERTTQGLVYRSGRLEKLTADGINTIVNELGIKTELDLREYGATYDVVSSYGVNFVQRSDGKTCLDHKAFLDKPEMAKESLLVFANADNYPILFNCYHGADRTGSLAFVLGALQGVSVADLLKDYELTQNRYLHRDDSLNIKEFMAAFNELEGDTLYQKARTFCKQAGLTDAEIDAIILNMRGQ